MSLWFLLQLTITQKSVLDLHDDFDTLAKADGLKGKKLAKVNISMFMRYLFRLLFCSNVYY